MNKKGHGAPAAMDIAMIAAIYAFVFAGIPLVILSLSCWWCGKQIKKIWQVALCGTALSIPLIWIYFQLFYRICERWQ